MDLVICGWYYELSWELVHQHFLAVGSINMKTSSVVPRPTPSGPAGVVNIHARSWFFGLAHLSELLAQRNHRRRVHSSRSTLPRTEFQRRRAPFYACVAYNWLVWSIAAMLVISQVFCIFKASYQYTSTWLIGQSPELGPYEILGDNDRPYSDRCITCVQQGRVIKPMFIRDALTSGRGVKIDSNSASTVNGYRILTRGYRVMDPDDREHWTHTCSVLSASMSSLVSACSALGYNVTATRLHVADESDMIYRISKSLPILILPIADNSYNARYVLPSSSGAACVLRVEGGNESPTYDNVWAWGVDREVVESKIQRWLGIRNGRWRHGWLEDMDTGVRWYEDMVNTRTEGTFGFLSRRFDAATGTEVDCAASGSHCCLSTFDIWWGDTLRSSETLTYRQMVMSGNGRGDGLFYMQRQQLRETWNLASYSLILSNLSMVALFIRWFVAITALHRYYYRHSNEVRLVGVGILSNSLTFRVLPFVLAPRLRVALAAFFTVGCAFEGDQLPLSDAWFIIYPGIAEVVLFVYGTLSLAAKLLKRRIADLLFGPTLIVLCLLHYLRQPLADSTWLGYEGRIPTVITASEYEKLSLIDFFTSDVALRMNGNVKVLIVIKLALLGVNIIPLFSGYSTSIKCHSKTRLSSAERILQLRPQLTGGLGQYTPFASGTISPYELVRHGHIIYGDLVVLSITDWYCILLNLLCRASGMVTLRVLLLPISAPPLIKRFGDPEECGAHYTCGSNLLFVRADNPWTLAARPWEISAMPLQ